MPLKLNTKESSLRLSPSGRAVFIGSNEVALKCAQQACKDRKIKMEVVPFGRLDFGETAVLDSFYNTDIAIVDISVVAQRAPLLYQLAVRESFDMRHNIVLLNDNDDEATHAISLSVTSHTFLPYTINPSNTAFISRKFTVGIGRRDIQGMTLLSGIKRKIKEFEINKRKHIKEIFLRDLRRAREKLSKEDLVKELTRLKATLDDPALFTADILHNLMLTYRDIQDYDSMVKLINELPNHKETMKGPIQQLYAFALNRRNKEGDRDKAIQVLEKMLLKSENHVPNVLCLFGRIYKDKFSESEYTDNDSRDKAIHWYRKGYKIQPNEYAGINLATLKGSLSSLEDYWDVATFFEVSVLAEDYTKTIIAAECMFKLKPQTWFLKSTLGNISLIKSFRKDPEDIMETRDYKVYSFWLDFFTEATQAECSDVRFPVLLMELTNEYIPCYILINTEAEEKSIRLWEVVPKDSNGITEWLFVSSSIKSVRGKGIQIFAFIEVGDNCSILHNEDTMFTEEPLEFEYELDDLGNRIVLGRGSFGTVFAGRNMLTKTKLAIKEIPIKVATNVEPLQEEIRLHSKISHKNIVQYMGAITEDGVFKIFMERVPGGSLSTLIKSKWGPLDENTIKYYTRQILEGIKYLHDQKIVHRDIKGDNVLVNTYNGAVKISDFGTSKRLAGLNPYCESFKGTMQYMAPEVIDKGLRGHGPPADIWSLGCTMIEMATGKPPFYELGDPHAAMFKVGMFKVHPDIPENLSSSAKDFLEKCCFEPDPNKRSTAAHLLAHLFLKRHRISKSLKSSTQRLKDPDQILSPGEEIGSIANSHSGSDDSPGSTIKYDSIASVPGQDASNNHFELVRKDSERQIIVLKVLKEQADKICNCWYDKLAMEINSDDLNTTKDDLKTLLSCLQALIENGDRQPLTELLGTPKFIRDSRARKELLYTLYLFRDVVNEVIKGHIKPHWIFAIEAHLKNAIDTAAEVFGPSGEAFEQGGIGTFHESSSSASLITKTTDQTSQYTSELHEQLAQLNLENQRLLEELVKVKQTFNRQLKADIDVHNHFTKALQSSTPTKGMVSEANFFISKNPGSKSSIALLLYGFYNRINLIDSIGEDDLNNLLKSLDFSSEDISKFKEEQFTYEDVMTCITREDLKELNLKGGPACRLWNHIVTNRSKISSQIND
ncbi:Mitogen-activated protein kinase kinase kinase 15 [Trichoplax sp. H2]|nr:Mitogen-activated protein kinase kinase kinase 15 [Trichoplax sp. H2]|eukprot:RDD42291.1 Mitogen-activated protein kinase kinase kinase 15 [Trichoplax sp. H2]